MDSESTPIVKLIAGAVGLVVVCFCVGFFLLGGRSSGNGAVPVAAAQPDATPSPIALEGGDSPKLSVVETTERRPSAPGNLRVADASPAGEATPAPKSTPKPHAKSSPPPSDTSEGATGVGAGKSATNKPKSGGTGDGVQIPAPQEGTAEATPKPDATEADDPSSTPGDAKSLYRVRVKNSFGSHDDADQLASELKGRGFAATVMPAGKGKFQVQIGAYKDKKRAEEKQKELEKNNYDTHISDKVDDGDKSEKSSDGGPKKEEGEKKAGDG